MKSAGSLEKSKLPALSEAGDGYFIPVRKEVIPLAYVPVPKDLTKVKTKVAFNLTKRQLGCFGCGALKMCIRNREKVCCSPGRSSTTQSTDAEPS